MSKLVFAGILLTAMTAAANAAPMSFACEGTMLLTPHYANEPEKVSLGIVVDDPPPAVYGFGFGASSPFGVGVPIPITEWNGAAVKFEAHDIISELFGQQSKESISGTIDRVTGEVLAHYWVNDALTIYSLKCK